jgi:uncharacterized membrane protein
METQAPQQQQAHLAQVNNVPSKGWVILFGAFALLGFLDATYLTIKHYLGTPLPCSILHGCEIVTTSIYSVIAASSNGSGGIPIALLGALYYLTILTMVIIYFDTKKIAVLKAACRLSIIGFLVSLVLVYLQLFVLHAICLYCMFSATTSTLIFITAMYLLALMKSQNKDVKE